MGTGSSKSVRCPQCNTFKTKDGKKFYQHITTEHRKESCVKCTHSLENETGQLNRGYESNHSINSNVEKKLLKCPQCDLNNLQNEESLLSHMISHHAYIRSNNSEILQCPECHVKTNRENLMSHMKVAHFQQQLSLSDIVCSLCTEKTTFKNSKLFIEHLERKHNYTQDRNQAGLDQHTDGKRLLPRVGDRILAMWGKSKWQYFHATIIRFIPSTMRYEINWDDGDTTGRIVDYFNIAVDKVPDKNEIGIGSIILFSQGQYKASGTQITGGLRWHQGEITEIYKSPDGKYDLYNGVHTKSGDDGKFVTYKGYSYEFTGYKLNDLRVGPNVFEILDEIDDNEGGLQCGDIDIYFSLEKSKQTLDEKSCNPLEIKNLLENNGLKVISSDLQSLESNLKEKARLMRDSKVFIACISNDYAHNAQCRMEFQYAKSTLKKPVVPLVFGKDMEWTKSVVGMLIAGELYIHMKDKSVQEQKLKEIFESINTYIGSKETLDTIANTETTSNLDGKPGEVFISYCWTNSYLARASNQIDKVIGTEYSDPRLIAKKLRSNNFATWLDIERLKSANQGAGLFEQLTKALTEAKVIVAFVSDEYTLSKNCQMEFQFSLKSLNKPVIPVVVGAGNEWEKTVVGLLLSTKSLEIIDLRGIYDSGTLDEKLKLIEEKLHNYLQSSQSVLSVKQAAEEGKFRAPRKGDHVISHHFKYCYYMATVRKFDRTNMQYTVAWDDGDITGTIQDYDQVALDIEPDEEDIGVGTNVFFVQGSYVIDGTPGVRYHEGIVTNMYRIDGTLYFDGHHRYGEADGKYCGFRNYSYMFKNLKLKELRIAPSALDVYMAS